MIALVMAGGKGTRMNSSEEKLLLEYKKPVIFHVLAALTLHENSFFFPLSTVRKQLFLH